MVADYYVNVNGKPVLYSSLDSSLKAKLDQGGYTQQETVKQAINTVSPQTFEQKDHIAIDQKGKVVSVPGRFAAAYGIEKPKVAKPKKLSAKEKIAAKKKKQEDDGFYYSKGGEEKGLRD